MAETNPAAYLGLYAAFCGTLPPINLHNIGVLMAAKERTPRCQQPVRYINGQAKMTMMKELYARH